MNKLLEYRTDSGLTQDELAELVGVSKQTIWNIENGESRGYGSTQIRIEKTLEEHRSKHKWGKRRIKRGDIFPSLLRKTS